MKQYLFIILIIAFVIGSALFWLSRLNVDYQNGVSYLPQPVRLWEYQCIDTMKTSRDQARSWKELPDLKARIDKEMVAISSLGANCVAIDTPYDDEFLPYLQTWVNAARQKNLRIWFRGNFSAWEGWFNYPKGMDETTLYTKTQDFILQNAKLFADNDIFTPAPEAENGGPFNQVDPAEYPRFRQFLIDQDKVAHNAFSQINKKVITNWLSMNGGLAQRALDRQTVESMGSRVTIDHYIAKALDMGEFIKYFHDSLGAQVVVGEWGAPIPDINGVMDQNTQATFVNDLLYQMYINKDHVYGLNYWVLTDSSTALLNNNYSSRKVMEVVKNYYLPGKITGTVRNYLGMPMKNITVTTDEGNNSSTTDVLGKYELIVPAGSHDVTIDSADYQTVSQKVDVDHSSEILATLKLTSKHPSFITTLLDKIISIWHP